MIRKRMSYNKEIVVTVTGDLYDTGEIKNSRVYLCNNDTFRLRVSSSAKVDGVTVMTVKDILIKRDGNNININVGRTSRRIA
jgi:hypothetical protein